MAFLAFARIRRRNAAFNEREEQRQRVAKKRTTTCTHSHLVEREDNNRLIEEFYPVYRRRSVDRWRSNDHNELAHQCSCRYRELLGSALLSVAIENI